VADNELHNLTSAAILVLGDDQLQNGKVSSLVMSGNRLDTSISFTSLENRILLDLGKPGSEKFFAALIYLYFFSAANIGLVTRCVISGNMILNQARLGEGVPARGSFLLNDLALPIAEPPIVTIPPPEISVEGNVFQGNVLIFPTPPPSNSITP
jgi:hypothetical protein